MIQLTRCFGFAITIWCALVTGTSSAQTATAPQLAIRSDGRYVDPASIWRYDARSTTIPINKRYDELTTDQKAVLAAQYVEMKPGDEPPYPKDGTQPIIQLLIKAQERLNTTGMLYLIVTVGSDGRASTVKALGKPDSRMVDFASKLLLLTDFKPGSCAGSPCEMDYLFTLNFRLHERRGG
jgi:hypothetical protein